MKATYIKTQLKNALTVSKIVTMHYYEFDKSFVFEGEEHDFWEMIYVDKGELDCTAGEERLVLSEGEVHFHRPGEYHRHAANGRRAPNVFVVSFVCRSEGMRFFEGRVMRLSAEERRHLFGILHEASSTFDIPVSDPATRKMKLMPPRAYS